MYAKVIVQLYVLNVLKILFVRIIAFNSWHVSTYDWYIMSSNVWEFNLNDTILDHFRLNLINCAYYLFIILIILVNIHTS